MTIPFLDLRKINAELDTDLKKAIESILASGWYILGKADERFEKEFTSSLQGNGPCSSIGCNSGTDALILSLLAAGVNPDDEVITVSHTAIPTVTAICAVRARPVLVDIDPRTWVMDIDKAMGMVTAKTKAIIPVHLYGNMVDVNRLAAALERTGRRDIAIIEDVAQAQGSILNGQQAGTIDRFGAFSFYPSKNIGALGDGGAIACASAGDAATIRMLRNYGQKDRYNAELPRGLNSRLDEIQAAVLSVKLPHLERWNKQKADQMAVYRRELSDLPIQFQSVTTGCAPGWHLCVIATERKEIRTSLMRYLEQEGIQTLIHYPLPTHQQKAFSAFSRHSLPITEDLADRILSLPLNTVLTSAEQTQIIESIRSFYRKG